MLVPVGSWEKCGVLLLPERKQAQSTLLILWVRKSIVSLDYFHWKTVLSLTVLNVTPQRWLALSLCEDRSPKDTVRLAYFLSATSVVKIKRPLIAYSSYRLPKFFHFCLKADSIQPKVSGFFFPIAIRDHRDTLSSHLCILVPIS